MQRLTKVLRLLLVEKSIWLDDFLLRENLSDPELQVTDDIIQKVILKSERSKYKRKPEDDNLYSTYIQALIEKKDIQNPVALVQEMGELQLQSLNSNKVGCSKFCQRWNKIS